MAISAGPIECGTSMVDYVIFWLALGGAARLLGTVVRALLDGQNATERQRLADQRREIAAELHDTELRETAAQGCLSDPLVTCRTRTFSGPSSSDC